jgi:hypothetical protein
MVSESWGHGAVFSGTLDEGAARYVAGYTIKKMTSVDDERLLGRHPEFARMSLRPGIGHDALWEIASTLMRYDLDEQLSDVPTSLRHQKHEQLGRYLRRKLRVLIGRDAAASEEVLHALAESLRPLRQAAKEDDDCPSFKAKVVEAFSQQVASLEARYKIHRQRKTL